VREQIPSVSTVDKAAVGPGKYWAGQRHFEHFNARSVGEAVSLLSAFKERAKIIAGGVDLVGLMKNNVLTPDVLVNIKAIPELACITSDAEGVKIGALITINDIYQSTDIRNKYSALAEGAWLVASPQIRNMATVVGNLCQEVRCWYYRRSQDTGISFSCRRKGGRSCYAATGDNRYHAILGKNQCAAVCPSDLAPILMALEAKLDITSPGGDKTISLEELYTALGSTMKPDEMITGIRLPVLDVNTKQRFLKFRLRRTIDFALSSVAAVITTESGVVKRTRIVLGGVSPVPYRAVAAEEVLRGKELSETSAEEAAKAALKDAAPLSMNAYKIALTKALVKRTITEMR